MNHREVFKINEPIPEPVLTLSGKLPLDINLNQPIKCMMCTQIVDPRKESIIVHSVMCTGY
ncbi:hypothetical protein L292_2082 [Acinetobacter junii CIP 107470 = MTCC 11364]|uniref:Uncharacterized protein n=1 Tax=Acinetobacter junii CIP 107470 = MTCC 11364 TaxID=1217666 RepID=S7YFQ1_ACIJU|nr:hypothetical protein F953_00484 [Acinetobacter junii CIP 107470 = MTCC 11364]EPR86848.1 hypothetical protein L292_2082 [Acinetobacter junii CIP 107470 = MTCC 11364]